MAAMTSKFNFECVIQYYTDQWPDNLGSLCKFLVIVDCEEQYIWQINTVRTPVKSEANRAASTYRLTTLTNAVSVKTFKRSTSNPVIKRGKLETTTRNNMKELCIKARIYQCV